MTYEKYLDYSSELQHAWFQRNKSNSINTGFRKKKPKYFKKDNGRYFYSQAEWDAHIRKLRGGVKKMADRFKKSAKRTLTGAKRSAYRTGMSLSRKAKSAAVTAKRASQSFSRMASKKMGEFRAAASKQIERGKMMAAVAMGHVRGQMRRFSDKVAKPGMDRAQKALDRVKNNVSRKINDIRTSVPEIVKAGRDAVALGLQYKKDGEASEDAYWNVETSRLHAAGVNNAERRKGPPTREAQARINEAKKQYADSVKAYQDAWDKGEITRKQLNNAKKRLRDNLDKLMR